MTRKLLSRLMISLVMLSCGGVQGADPCRPGHLPLPPEGADNVVTSFLGNPVMWPGDTFPLRVIIFAEVSSDTRHAVSEAATAWNETIGLQVFTVSTAPDIPRNLRGIIWVSEEHLPKSTCDRQVLGLARRFYEMGFLGERLSIHHASIRMHDAFTATGVRSTAMHELGHALGLQHDRDEESIMYPYSHPDRVDVTEEDRSYIVRMARQRR